jgi:hypothetical protein
MEEAAAQKAKLEEQAANRRAACITYGFGTGKYGTVPDSWPVKYGGKGGLEHLLEGPKLRGGENDAEEEEELSEEQKRKRRRLEKKALTTSTKKGKNRAESPEQEFDIAEGFPSLAGGAPTYGPVENIAPIAPSLGTPFDPHVKRDWYGQIRKSQSRFEKNCVA